MVALVARLGSPTVSLADIAQGVAVLARGVLEKENAKIARAEKAKKEKESGVVPKPRQTKAPKREVVGVAPDASDYRVGAINTMLCKGRRYGKTMDERWTKPVFYEEQCQSKPIQGEEICVNCAKRQMTYAEDPTKGAGTKTAWAGRIDEEPLDTAHMIGTAWARDLQEKGKLKWQGFVKEKKAKKEKVSGAASVVTATDAPKADSDPESDAEDAPEEEAAAVEVSEEALCLAIVAILKTKTDDELSAYTPADARAELSEKYGSVKDFKEVVKTCVKETKEALGKQRLAAAKPKAEKAKAPAKPKAEKAEKPKAVKTTAAAKPVKPAGKLTFADGVPCWVLENGNAYEYDTDTNVVGEFMGVYDFETSELDADAVAV